MFEIIRNLTGGAPAAGLLLGLMIVVSVAALNFAPQLIPKLILRPYQFVREKDYFSLIGSGFIHANYAHLFFNAITFWSFGFPLERRTGTVRFIALYMIGLIVSDLGTIYKQRDNPEYASLGASGAILAVLFASIIYFPTQSIFIMPLPIPIPAALYAVGYLAYTIYASRHAHDNINHDAHLSGAIAGVVFVMLTDQGAVQEALRQVGLG